GAEWLGIALACCILSGAIVWIRGTKSSFAATCGIAACAGVLCAPLAWHTFILIAAPFFVVRRWNRMEATTALTFFLPAALAPETIGVLYLLSTLAMLICFCASSAGHAGVESSQGT